jgi:pyruvate formate lyase activating enzyme
MDDIMERIGKNRDFIRGITCSGGECTIQKDFLTALFERVRALGLSTLLDSNGSLDFSNEPGLMAVTDGVILDVKAVDPSAHHKLTGVGNQTVLKNLIFLARQKKLAEISVVAAEEGFFRSFETVDKTSRLLSRFAKEGGFDFRIIAFRPFGVRPKFNNIRAPSAQTLQKLKELAEANGIARVSII